MTVSFHRRDNGFTHVCAHRGYSTAYPENTLLALEMGRRHGATTFEIDIVLTRDEEIVLLHDRLLERTTTGHGFAADATLAEISRLEALGPGRRSFSDARVPTLGEVIDWAKTHGVGLVVEIKEKERVETISRHLLDLLREKDAFGHCIVISFDHVDLARLREREPLARTEAICHARHADIVAVLRSCGAESVSIELGMFHEDDARALHAAGLANRLSLPLPEKLMPYWAYGRDPRPRIAAWLRDGLVDSLSGDDVPFLTSLLAEAGAAATRPPAAAGRDRAPA